jgi:hypothetical protein
MPRQSPEWEDPKAAREMEALLRVRTSVLGLLEKARGNKCARRGRRAAGR